MAHTPDSPLSHLSSGIGHLCTRMCGILLYTGQSDSQLTEKIRNRGPDFDSLEHIDGISFFSSVLSLRSPFTPQPLIDDDFVIQFNGELYNDEVNGNDTQWAQSLLESTRSVTATVHKMDGEFAFVIYQKSTKTISFGRDPVGKRSLVYSTANGELVVSSVQPLLNREQYTDCRNGVIYQYHLDTRELKQIENQVLSTINTDIDTDFQHINERLEQLQEMLTLSVEKRIRLIQPLHIEDPHDALYSILFSGGLDCTVIAGLAASLSSPGTTIDLLNVGFDNPRTGMTADQAPDRVLGLQSWLELCKAYPEVQFNLIEINVPYEEYQAIRPRVIELMFPKNTEMDLSIAIAFYFASRGRGIRLHSTDHTKEGITRHPGYQSKAKVLLSGLGADELYGGYHKFANKDLETLAPELHRQINNIHERNLMRDDKVISDNGVEVRYPFLSNQVIKFSTEQIEINYKVSKYILRELAKRIKLAFVAEEPKRAIQFGAKSAKIIQTGKVKGTDALS